MALRFLSRLVTLTLAFVLPSIVVAQPPAMSGIVSRQATQVDGKLYIAAGINNNSQHSAQALLALWDSDTTQDAFTDNYRQPWKSVDIAQLEELFGEIPEDYSLMYVDNTEQWGSYCGDDGGSGACDRPLPRLRQSHMKVQRAMLFQWGCDGSIVPALELGLWPWGQIGYDWPPVIALNIGDAPKFDLIDLEAIRVPGMYRSEQLFNHALFNLATPERDLYLQLEYVPDEDNVIYIWAKVGDTPTTLNPIQSAKIFSGSC